MRDDGKKRWQVEEGKLGDGSGCDEVELDVQIRAWPPLTSEVRSVAGARVHFLCVRAACVCGGGVCRPH